MFKSKAPEKDQDVAANAAEAVERALHQQHSVVEQPPPKREPTTNAAATRSCIGAGMAIVGNIECNGPAQVFGRIKGEVRASDLLIGDGAQIEGSVIAQDVTVLATSRAPSASSASEGAMRKLPASRAGFRRLPLPSLRAYRRRHRNRSGVSPRSRPCAGCGTRGGADRPSLRLPPHVSRFNAERPRLVSKTALRSCAMLCRLICRQYL